MPLTMHWAPYHVHFDGQPKIEGHICDITRQFGQVLVCPDGDADTTGNCEHVQIKPCDCACLVSCGAHDNDAEAQLDIGVQRALAAGNWPVCASCQQSSNLGYMGLVDGAPTFLCQADSTVFAMNFNGSAV